jgi:hypothetical protein
MPNDASVNGKSLRATERFECIALLLQGGGALGSYQGGVYQALRGQSPSRLGRWHFDRRRQLGFDRWKSAGKARRETAGLLGSREQSPAAGGGVRVVLWCRCSARLGVWRRGIYGDKTPLHVGTVGLKEKALHGAVRFAGMFRAYPVNTDTH